MKKTHNKRAVGFTIGQYEQEGGYLKLELKVYAGWWADLAKVYAENGCKYDLEYLKSIRESTGQTWCFGCRDSRQLSIEYQSHRYASDSYEVKNGEKEEGSWYGWYAPRLVGGHFNLQTAKLYSRIIKAHEKAKRGYDETPETLVQTLYELNAVPLKYYSNIGLDRYVEDTEFSLDSLVPKSADRARYV